MKISEISLKGEKTLGKEEIARYEQFLLFPQCFQKARFQEASKGVIVWEWVKPLNKSSIQLTPSKTTILDYSKRKVLAGDNFKFD